jgi:hypothetical protein
VLFVDGRRAQQVATAFLCALLTGGAAHAQGAVVDPTPAPGWRTVRAGTFSPLDPFHAGFGIGSGVGWVTEQAAQANRVGGSGPTLHLDVDGDFFDLVTLGGSLGTIFLKDDGSYTQTVIDSEGEVSDAKSSLNLTLASVFTGLRTPDLCLAANERMQAGWVALYGFTRFGHTWVGGGRSIAQCIDCRSEEVSPMGGWFIEPGLSLGLKANDSWGASLVSSYRGYPAGAGVAGEWRISLMFHNW